MSGTTLPQVNRTKIVLPRNPLGDIILSLGSWLKDQRDPVGVNIGASEYTGHLEVAFTDLVSSKTGTKINWCAYGICFDAGDCVVKVVERREGDIEVYEAEFVLLHDMNATHHDVNWTI